MRDRLFQSVLRCAAAAATFASCGFGQTEINLPRQARNIDFSNAVSTKPLQTGTVLPAACAVGQMFFLANAAPGSNVFACTSTNTWTLEGGGLSGGGLTANAILKAGSAGVSNSNLAEDLDGSDKAGQALTWAAPFRPGFAANGTTTCDLSRSNVCEIDFGGGNTMLGLINAHGSGPYLLRSCQDTTGGRSYTFFPSNTIAFAQPDAGASTCTEQPFNFDGATFRGGVASVPNASWRGATYVPGSFSNLPACSSQYEGSLSGVVDSTSNTWGAAVSGSGTFHVLAYCDGTTWTVAAK